MTSQRRSRSGVEHSLARSIGAPPENGLGPARPGPFPTSRPTGFTGAPAPINSDQVLCDRRKAPRERRELGPPRKRTHYRRSERSARPLVRWRCGTCTVLRHSPALFMCNRNMGAFDHTLGQGRAGLNRTSIRHLCCPGCTSGGLPDLDAVKLEMSVAAADAPSPKHSLDRAATLC